MNAFSLGLALKVSAITPSLPRLYLSYWPAILSVAVPDAAHGRANDSAEASRTVLLASLCGRPFRVGESAAVHLPYVLRADATTSRMSPSHRLPIQRVRAAKGPLLCAAASDIMALPHSPMRPPMRVWNGAIA